MIGSPTTHTPHPSENQHWLWKPGQSGNPKGRPAGSIDASLRLKQAVLTALSELDTRGGIDYLKRQAEANPVAFLGLLGRLLPKQVTGVDGGPIEHAIHAVVYVPTKESANMEVVDREVAGSIPARIAD